MIIKYAQISPFETEKFILDDFQAFDEILIDKIPTSVEFFKRPKAKLFKKLIKSGVDFEIHVSSIQQLGCNLSDVMSTIQFFHYKNITLFIENLGLYSIQRGEVNSTFTLLSWVIFDCDSLEKTYKKETQRIGIEKAKANNTYTGRLHGTKMSKEDVLKKYNNVVELLNKGFSLRKCAKHCDCSLGTVQKVKRLIDTED